MCYSRNECSLRVLPREIVSMICNYLVFRNFYFVKKITFPKWSQNYYDNILGIFKGHLVVYSNRLFESACITLIDANTGFITKKIF